MERWEKSNSNFNLEEETEQSPEDVIKEAQHPPSSPLARIF